MMSSVLSEIREQALAVLTENILPFWMEKMVDQENGGFYGKMDGEGKIYPFEDKGAILNARILWTFSAAYRSLRRPEYLENATRAKDYLIEHFFDSEFGGVFWSVDYKGRPADTKKQFYALSFAIYGLSEYCLACSETPSLREHQNEVIQYAIKLFESIENYSYDPVYKGYIEACTRDWGEISDMRLSDKDANEKKTMNTHLHILEGYTNLYRVWKNDSLRFTLEKLVLIFLDKIENPATHHLGLFFDEKWKRVGNEVSYGHDIEASWLLLEAAEVLGDSTLLERVREHSRLIATAALEGLQGDGGMIYEVHSDGTVDRDRHWWVQAETVVGLYYQFKMRTEEASSAAMPFASSDAEALLLKMQQSFSFITNYLIDNTLGEWYWSVRSDGTINRTDDHAGFWKCPYHNSRMCLELIK